MAKEKQKWFQKTWVRLMGILLIGTIIFYVVIKDGNGNGLETIRLTKGNITQEVLVSGTVKSGKNIELSFEKSGKVAVKNKKTGDGVYAGELILALDSKNELASLEDAKARLKSAEANLAEVKRGTRPEEISVKESELAKAKQDLSNYYESVSDYINDAYNKSDDAVNRQTDDLFNNDQGPDPEITFSVGDQQYKTIAKEARIKAGLTVTTLQKLSDSINATSENKILLDQLDTAISYMNQIQGALIKISNALDSAIGPSATIIATHKSSMGTARTNVNTALKSLSDLRQNINSQTIYAEKVERELALAKAGPTNETLAQAESSLQIAEAGVKTAEANYAKNFIYSPISGIVSKLDVEIGETISASSVIASVINDKKFEVEALVPEADVVKIAVGNTANISLDAYGENEIFNAEITNIDPAEKIVDGVPTYKTILTFKDKEEKIRSGLTANVTIVSAQKENVWKMPQKALKQYNKENIIFYKAPKNSTLTINGMGVLKIEIGVKSSDGFIEIVNADQIQKEYGVNLSDIDVVLNPII